MPGFQSLFITYFLVIERRLQFDFGAFTTVCSVHPSLYFRLYLLDYGRSSASNFCRGLDTVCWLTSSRFCLGTCETGKEQLAIAVF